MKLFLLGLVVLGFSLMAWGFCVANGRGSADERVAGAYPMLAGGCFVALGVVVGFVWMLARS